MEIRFILQILNHIGLISTVALDDLKEEDRKLLMWISSNIPTTEILAIESCDDPFSIYASWVRAYSGSVPNNTQTKKKPEEVTAVEAPAVDLSDNVVYPSRTPHSHELVPRSVFGLQIFSTNEPGTSFEHIDKTSMQFIINSLSLNFDDPELLGVTLDPAFDASLFRAILSSLRGAPMDEFEERDVQGNIVQEGRMHSVDYRSLVNRDKYASNTLRSPQLIRMVDRSCKRISQLRLSYKTDDENGHVAKYTPFFSHLQFNMTSMKVEYIGTTLIPQLFRDDKTLSLNTKTLNLSNGKIESSLLYYLTSLPRGFAKPVRHVPLQKPVPILALLARCYPKVALEKLARDYPKIERVKAGMLSLKSKNLITFSMEGRGQKIIYKGVIHFCEMNDVEFSTLERDDDPAIKVAPDNSLRHYLETIVAPRRASDTQKLEFGEKVIPNAFAIIDASTDESLVESFRGVIKHKLVMLRRYAEIVGHAEMVECLDRIVALRK
ncbi:hypothetical protein [Enterovibrio norvegicus]|uniref:hypothetical protein n=1 Tax=Enterovibrio norvegicus TaxID=188144 RepID=UPI00352D2FD1